MIFDKKHRGCRQCWFIVFLKNHPTWFIGSTSISQILEKNVWISFSLIDPHALFTLIGSVIGSFIHSFIHSLVCSYIRSFYRSFYRSFVLSFVRSIVRSFVQSLVSITSMCYCWSDLTDLTDLTDSASTCTLHIYYRYKTDVDIKYLWE